MPNYECIPAKFQSSEKLNFKFIFTIFRFVTFRFAYKIFWLALKQETKHNFFSLFHLAHFRFRFASFRFKAKWGDTLFRTEHLYTDMVLFHPQNQRWPDSNYGISLSLNKESLPVIFTNWATLSPEDLGPVEKLEVPAEADILLELQRVLYGPHILLRADPVSKIINNN